MGDTYRLVGENTNKGKCYAERDSERERVIPIVLLVKTPTRAEHQQGRFLPIVLLVKTPTRAKTLMYVREGCGGRRLQPPVRPASAGAYGSEADPGASPTAPSDIIGESFRVFWRGTA